MAWEKVTVKVNNQDVHGMFNGEDLDIPVKRPWYMHTGQDDNLLVLQGTRYIDIFDRKTLTKSSFIVTPEKVYKNDKLYFDGPAMVVWPAGIFHRIISGVEGSISVNFATRTAPAFSRFLTTVAVSFMI